MRHQVIQTSRAHVRACAFLHALEISHTYSIISRIGSWEEGLNLYSVCQLHHIMFPPLPFPYGKWPLLNVMTRTSVQLKNLCSRMTTLKNETDSMLERREKHQNDNGVVMNTRRRCTLGDGKKSIPVFISFFLALSLTVSFFTPPAVNFKYLEKARVCVCLIALLYFTAHRWES